MSKLNFGATGTARGLSKPQTDILSELTRKIQVLEARANSVQKVLNIAKESDESNVSQMVHDLLNGRVVLLPGGLGKMFKAELAERVQPFGMDIEELSPWAVKAIRVVAKPAPKKGFFSRLFGAK